MPKIQKDTNQHEAKNITKRLNSDPHELMLFKSNFHISGARGKISLKVNANGEYEIRGKTSRFGREKVLGTLGNTQLLAYMGHLDNEKAKQNQNPYEVISTPSKPNNKTYTQLPPERPVTPTSSGVQYSVLPNSNEAPKQNLAKGNVKEALAKAVTQVKDVQTPPTAKQLKKGHDFIPPVLLNDGPSQQSPHAKQFQKLPPPSTTARPLPPTPPTHFASTGPAQPQSSHPAAITHHHHAQQKQRAQTPFVTTTQPATPALVSITTPSKDNKKKL
jgi:hypothetical protein